MSNKKAQHTQTIDACVVLGDTFLPNDLNTLFENEKVIQLKENAAIVDILTEVGITPSRNQARKNSFVSFVKSDGSLEKKVKSGDASVPFGYSEIVSGKLKHTVAIWNPSPVGAVETFDEQKHVWNGESWLPLTPAVEYYLELYEISLAANTMEEAYYEELDIVWCDMSEAEVYLTELASEPIVERYGKRL